MPTIRPGVVTGYAIEHNPSKWLRPYRVVERYRLSRAIRSERRFRTLKAARAHLDHLMGSPSAWVEVS